MVVAAGAASSPPRAPMAPVRARSGLISNAFANSFGLLDQIIEEITDIIGHAADHGEDLFEDVSDEIRGRNTEIVGKISNILGKLFGNSGMENPLLARTMAAMAAATGGMARIE